MFELRAEGLTLVEIAPGIDLQTEILDLMEFKPIVVADLVMMDLRIFKEQVMGLQHAEESISKKAVLL